MRFEVWLAIVARSVRHMVRSTLKGLSLQGTRTFDSHRVCSASIARKIEFQENPLQRSRERVTLLNGANLARRNFTTEA